MWWTSTIGLGTAFLVQLSVYFNLRSFESSIRLVQVISVGISQALGCLLCRSLLPPGKREGCAAKKSPRSLRSISLDETIAPLNQLGSWFGHKEESIYILYIYIYIIIYIYICNYLLISIALCSSTSDTLFLFNVANWETSHFLRSVNHHWFIIYGPWLHPF